MDEYISMEQHLAEVGELNCEIRKLSQKMKNIKEEHRCGVFDNPTEYEGFSGKYTDIQPLSEEPDYRVPLEPDYSERRKLKKYYTSASVLLLVRYLFVEVVMFASVRGILFFFSSANPEIDSATIYDYMLRSSILSGVNMIVFIIANVLFAFWGLKRAGIKKRSIVRTRDFSAPQAFQYCLVGYFIWYVSAYISIGVDDVFSKYGFEINSSSLDNLGETSLGFVVMMVYTCIIAPITEEIFYRGMVLRVFSKANQRFGVLISAFIFGIGHGNIPQFILAFLLGIFLAHITLKHNSVIPSILVHIFVNSVSSAIGELYESEPTIVMAVEMVMIAAAAVGFIMFIVFKSNNKLPSPTPPQTRRGFAIAVNSLPLIVLFAFHFYDVVSDLLNNS